MKSTKPYSLYRFIQLLLILGLWEVPHDVFWQKVKVISATKQGWAGGVFVVSLKEKSATTEDNAFPKPTLMRQMYAFLFYPQIFLTFNDEKVKKKLNRKLLILRMFHEEIGETESIGPD